MGETAGQILGCVCVCLRGEKEREESEKRQWLCCFLCVVYVMAALPHLSANRWAAVVAVDC